MTRNASQRYLSAISNTPEPKPLQWLSDISFRPFRRNRQRRKACDPAPSGKASKSRKAARIHDTGRVFRARLSSALLTRIVVINDNRMSRQRLNLRSICRLTVAHGGWVRRVELGRQQQGPRKFGPEEWWRRGELNPRPRKPAMKRLRAYPAQYSRPPPQNRQERRQPSPIGFRPPAPDRSSWPIPQNDAHSPSRGLSGWSGYLIN